MESKKRKTEVVNTNVEAKAETVVGNETQFNIAKWDCLLREIAFRYDCSIIFQCVDQQEVICFDNDNNQHTVTIGRLRMPTTLLFMLELIRGLVNNIVFKSVITTGKLIKHDLLPVGVCDSNGKSWFYEFC